MLAVYLSADAARMYGIHCRCWRGSAKSELFNLVDTFILTRFWVGFALGENRFKMIPYFFLPFFVGNMINHFAIIYMGH